MKQNPNLLGDERSRVDKMVKTHEAVTQNGTTGFQCIGLLDVFHLGRTTCLNCMNLWK